MGLHTVLYPWLVVGVLELSPSQLGLAQLAVLLPNLLFILPGGVISDRRHRGSWLSLLYILYSLPIAILIGAALSGELTFSLLLMFGMVFGSISAFVQPARESLLGYASQDLMHQAVAKVVMVQFIAQGIGFIIAGQLDTVGLTALLVVQMLMFILSSILIKRSHPQLVIETDIDNSKEQADEPKRETLQELRAGFALFLTDKALLHLLLIVTATGFLAFGVYLVGMPLLARQAYQGGAGLYAILQVTFTMGIVVANFVVSRQKNTFQRPGRLMIISFLGRGGLLAVVALMPNFWILFPVIFAWGAFSGNVDDPRAHHSPQSGSTLPPIACRIGLSALPVCRRTAGCLGLWFCHRAGGIGADLYGNRSSDIGSFGDCRDNVAAMGVKGD